MCLRKSGVENSRGQKRTKVYTQLVADGGCEWCERDTAAGVERVGEILHGTRHIISLLRFSLQRVTLKLLNVSFLQMIQHLSNYIAWADSKGGRIDKNSMLVVRWKHSHTPVIFYCISRDRRVIQYHSSFTNEQINYALIWMIICMYAILTVPSNRDEYSNTLR